MTSLFTKISRLPEAKRKRVKEALDLLENEQCLVSKSNSNPDDRLGLYAQIDELTEHLDKLLAAANATVEAFDGLPPHSETRMVPLRINGLRAAIAAVEQQETTAAYTYGWNKWDGGEYPVPEGTMVIVKYRMGLIDGPFPALRNLGKIRDAGPEFWCNNGNRDDIIAYRVVQGGA